MADAWVAFFCPHCGGTINEADLDTDDMAFKRRRMAGPAYTCWWCKERQTDWGHVKQCKALYLTRKREQMEHAERATLDLLSDLVGGT